MGFNRRGTCCCGPTISCCSGSIPTTLTATDSEAGFGSLTLTYNSGSNTWVGTKTVTVQNLDICDGGTHIIDCLGTTLPVTYTFDATCGLTLTWKTSHFNSISGLQSCPDAGGSTNGSFVYPRNTGSSTCSPLVQVFTVPNTAQGGGQDRLHCHLGTITITP